ncbi:hypothetical protein ACR79M_11305 [Sphingobacterium spiritivorum]|uniref:hypothetical protein n=2 Tax=Sphingobacterium spiritivorum TaxID=258 RepID=UPI003DA6598B
MSLHKGFGIFMIMSGGDNRQYTNRLKIIVYIIFILFITVFSSCPFKLAIKALNSNQEDITLHSGRTAAALTKSSTSVTCTNMTRIRSYTGHSSPTFLAPTITRYFHHTGLFSHTILVEKQTTKAEDYSSPTPTYLLNLTLLI